MAEKNNNKNPRAGRANFFWVRPTLSDLDRPNPAHSCLLPFAPLPQELFADVFPSRLESVKLSSSGFHCVRQTRDYMQGDQRSLFPAIIIDSGAVAVVRLPSASSWLRHRPTCRRRRQTIFIPSSTHNGKAMSSFIRKRRPTKSATEIGPNSCRVHIDCIPSKPPDHPQRRSSGLPILRRCF
jgi:hypothetical protein